MKDLNIGIPLENRNKTIDIIYIALASETILNLKIRHYHWNIEAKNFSELHSFFETLYDLSSEQIDDLAERIRMLWAQVKANQEQFLEASLLESEKNINLDSNTMIQQLLNDYETMIVYLRAAISQVWDLWDIGTEDFLTGLIQAHEKNAWMLRSML